MKAALMDVWYGETEYSAAQRAASARIIAGRRSVLTPSEQRTMRRIRARWRLAEYQARRRRMRRIA